MWGPAQRVPLPQPARIRPGGIEAACALALAATLAMVAVPAHRNAAQLTRESEVRAIADGVRGATRFAHSLWQAQGGPSELQVRRGRVAMVHGYPSSAGVGLLLEDSELMRFRTGGAVTLQHRDAPGPCGVRYAAPGGRGEAPVIVPVLAGC